MKRGELERREEKKGKEGVENEERAFGGKVGELEDWKGVCKEIKKEVKVGLEGNAMGFIGLMTKGDSWFDGGREEEG